MNRLRQLLICGLIDSFGLSLGWTVFVLFGHHRGGMDEAALYNAAMLIGIVLAAPATGWLAARLDGKRLLRAMTVTEAILRIATFAALLAGLPSTLIAAGVLVMYMAGWTTYAAMRAEVAAADARPRAMTGYGTGVATIEAAGVGLAALLPVASFGDTSTASGDRLLPAVMILYAASLLPTYLSARRARVTATRLGPGRAPLPYGALGAGAGIAFLATGPTLLAVALAAELHGTAWVAGSAAAFTVGCLCSTAAVDFVARLRLPPTIGWPLWGVGMLIGWVIAPLNGTAFLAAQFLSGLSMTAFEGDMDARVAADTDAGAVTRVLAWTASIRALGSALAVRMLPVMTVAPAIGILAGSAVGVLAVSSAAATVMAFRTSSSSSSSDRARASDVARFPNAARLIDAARRPPVTRLKYAARLVHAARFPYAARFPHAARLIDAARRPPVLRLPNAARLIQAARFPQPA
jgi:hypothetical protein